MNTSPETPNPTAHPDPGVTADRTHEALRSHAETHADIAAIRPRVLICMGVSGAGKSTVALLVDKLLGWPFQEGDELHSPENVEKMRQGTPLTDEDRWPWIDRCRDWIDGRLAADGRGLITCSALRRAYRERLIGAHKDAVRILYLRASREILLDRLQHRTGHYMPVSLLDSQLHTLEEPASDENPIVVDVEQTPDEMIREILRKLREQS